MGFKPNWNAHWSPTIGEIKANGVNLYACCTKCSAQRLVDLDAMIAAKGPDLRLKNKRTRTCRMKPGCDGQNYFAHDRSGGIITPFRDQETSIRWLSER